MPTDTKTLIRVITELESFIADIFRFIPQDKVEEYHDKYLIITGDKDE